MIPLKKAALATAVAALSLGALGPAHAASLAYAQLDITNFEWLDAGGNVLTNIITNDPYVVIAANGANSGSINASVTGYAGASTGSITSPILTGGQIPLTTACSGPGCGVAPDSTAPAAGTFAYGSIELTGAIVNLDTTAPFTGPATITGGADAKATANVGITTNTDGTTQSTLGTNTAFDFVYTGVSQLTTFSLDYFLKDLASVDPVFGLSDQAQGGIQWTLTLNDLTDQVNALTWTPTQLQDTFGTGAGELPDGETRSGTDLNQSVSLTGGHTYRLIITHSVFANANQNVVPEPGTMALLGVALAGLGFTRRLRSKQQS